ncbi:DNA polymerase IV [Thermodesulfobacteriota bacterium]
MPASPRSIIHLDMDAFYASVEQLDNPALKGKPVIVGGSSKRGVVSAASYEARRYKIHSAMPIAQAMKLCPHGFFLPVRMKRYKEISSQVFRIFQKYTPLVEPLSLDEAFLDVTGSAKLFGTAEDIAKRIRKEVFQETGLTISAGVAASKLVAKIASDLNKPDGLTIVPFGREAEFLAPLPIRRLWGVGKKTQETLSLLGVHSFGDIASLPEKLLEQKFGKHGISLRRKALGLDNRDVETEHETKSVGHEFTFDTDLVELETIRRELLELAVMLAKRLRRYQLQGKTITLKVKYHDFKQITRSSTIKHHSADSKCIYEKTLQLLKKTDAGQEPIRLLGISVSGLRMENGSKQQFLFQGMQTGRKRQEINKALDEIQEKYGSTAILPGRLLGGDK